MTAMPISVSIVEDNPGTRKNLVALLSGEPQLRLLNAYASGEEAVRGIVPADRPDVVVVDIKLPGMSGIECVSKLKSVMPNLPVLILTTYQARHRQAHPARRRNPHPPRPRLFL
jgi:DNA-binding NarL/FixJ family response regulator